jgi:hypothetical protein
MEEFNMEISPRTRAIAVLVVAALAACSGGCSSSNSTPTTPPPTPAITISTSASSLDLTQGATATIPVIVTRSGGFTGDVAVTVEGLPTGVTASALIISSAISSGTITLTALATAVVAASNLTVRGSGSGVTSVTASIALNVRVAAATGAVSVTFAPSTLTIVQGTTVNMTATITRTGGFTGAVTFTVTGLPTGLTVAITPGASTNQTVVTGTSATFAFTATAALAAGAYNIVVTASGTSVTANSVTVSTTVNAAATTNATWTFCPSSGIPVFVAIQDGTTADFVKVNPGANNSYAFAITQSKGAVAYEYQPSANNYQLFVFYGTQAELESQGAAICAGQTQTAKTVMGAVVGLETTDFATVNLGSVSATITLETGSAFTLNNVPSGALDLVGARTTVAINGSSLTYTLASILVRRNQSLANGATISPPVDLSAISAEAVAPVARVLTVTGLNGDQAEIVVYYTTSTGRAPLFFSASTPLTAATRTFYTMPASKQAAGDYHEVYVTAASGFTATLASITRFASTAFFASADKSVTLGPVPSAVTISNVTFAAPVRLNALFQVQAEYNKTFRFFMSQQGTNPRSVTLQYTVGYVGSPATWNAVVPNLTPAGYPASWGLQPQVMTTIFTDVAGWSTTGGVLRPPFVEGATTSSASRFMTYLP